MIRNETIRAYLYRVLLAVQPLAIAYGLTTSELAALWVSVVSAVLGFTLATVNTSTRGVAQAPVFHPPTNPSSES